MSKIFPWDTMTNDGFPNILNIPKEFAEREKPKYLLLSERMGDGETLEELGEKARRIIESACTESSRVGQMDKPLAS